MENKFMNSSYYRNLQNDIQREYRQIGHALDNYGVDMPKELREALEGLYEAHRAIIDTMRLYRSDVDNV